MNIPTKLINILFSFLLAIVITSCSNDPVHVSKKEYSSKKSDGFWNIRNNKAISYNQKVAKPKRDRQMKRLAAENKRIEKQNTHQKKRIKDNEELLKTFDHH